MTVNYFRIENFLSFQENQQILEWVVSHETEFVKSSVTTNAEDFRRSRVLYNFPWTDLITKSVEDLLSLALKALNVKLLALGNIECQMTAHNDGDYFQAHADNGDRCRDRVISYVYYFHCLPKAFSGGELVIHGRETPIVIEPANNSLVCFSSSSLHEVLPIRCPSQQFKDSRFTINGWINQFDPETIPPSIVIHP